MGPASDRKMLATKKSKFWDNKLDDKNIESFKTHLNKLFLDLVKKKSNLIFEKSIFGHSNRFFLIDEEILLKFRLIHK